MFYRNANGNTYRVLSLNIEMEKALLENITSDQYLVVRGFDLEKSSWAGASYYNNYNSAYINYHLDCLERTIELDGTHIARLMDYHEINMDEVSITEGIMNSSVLQNYYELDLQEFSKKMVNVYSSREFHNLHDSTYGRSFLRLFMNTISCAEDKYLLGEFLVDAKENDIKTMMIELQANIKDHTSKEKAYQRTIDDTLYNYEKKIKSNQYVY